MNVKTLAKRKRAKLPAMATIANSWKRTPFTVGTPIAYGAVFSAEELERIKMGLLPREMEDKWFVHYEEPYIFFHRSWTGFPVFRVALQKNDSGAEVTESLCSKEMVASPSFDAGYQAQLLDFLISNLLLKKHKPFPLPPGLNEQQRGIFQHHISGTGDPERKPEK